MKMLKYQASTMREALAQIKDELGSDAMVVATRDVRRGLLGKGVEVSVAIDIDSPETSSPSPTRRSSGRQTGAGFSIGDADVERIMAPLRSELRSLRSLLRMSNEAKQNDELRREMTAMRQLLSEMRERSVDEITVEQAAGQTDKPMAKRCSGRITVLVGPTGVGKTTTIAKLAANAVYLDHEATAIVTLDTYRVGGEEQMRTYANLIGAPLFVVADPADLPAQIEQLGEYDKVFIDTAGRSPRDIPAIAALHTALQGIEELEVHLTLAMTTPRDVIDANSRRYAKVGVSRLLFTKLDEAVDFRELVHAPVRLQIPVSYLTTGQAVPEDIEVASDEGLLEYARHGGSTLMEAA